MSTIIEDRIVLWFHKEYGMKQCMHFDNWFSLSTTSNYLAKTLCIVDHIGDVCDISISGEDWDSLAQSLEDHMNIGDQK